MIDEGQWEIFVGQIEGFGFHMAAAGG